MSVTFKYVEDVIQEELNIQCPEFDVCKGSPYVFTLMRPQFRAEFIYDEMNGPVIKNPSFNNACKDLFKKAKEKNIDVLLTPEYCVSYDLIEEIIIDEDGAIKPNLGKIWCICCQGIKYDLFLDYLNKYEELGAKVIREAVKNADSKNFVNALMYLFMLPDESICIIPQLKTQIMGDRELLCEGMGMSIGHTIFKFGKQKINQLCSIICADSLNLSSISIRDINNGNENVILLHPQLNKKPRDSSFCRLRNTLYDQSSCDNLIYITANWAFGSKLTHSSSPNTDNTIVISNPWTCIYIKDTNGKSINKQRDLRKGNYTKGIGFGYLYRNKLQVWYSLKYEMMHIITIKKPRTNGASVTQPVYDVTVNEVYLRSNDDEWIQQDRIVYNDDLKSLVKISEDDEIYNFPLKSEKDVRDIFFGICLGNFEEGQLLVDDNELCNTISIHIDDECEKQRIESIDKFNILVEILRNMKLPPRLKTLVDSHKFSLEDNLLNIISDDDTVKTKAAVAYVPKEEEARRISEHLREKINMCKNINTDLVRELLLQGKIKEATDYLPDNHVCVFTIKKGSLNDIISYPNYKNEVTAPDRVASESSIVRC